jgi:bacterioferritin (cytochrome b1)
MMHERNYRTALVFLFILSLANLAAAWENNQRAKEAIAIATQSMKSSTTVSEIVDRSMAVQEERNIRMEAVLDHIDTCLSEDENGKTINPNR